MTNQALVLNISETMATLMRSSGTYVYKRLTTEVGKEAYKNAMLRCIKYVSSGLESLEMIKARIEGLRSEVKESYPMIIWYRKHEEYKYHNIAIDQAMEIVKTLEARFVTGSYDPIPRNYKNTVVTCYSDENPFGDNNE